MEIRNFHVGLLRRLSIRNFINTLIATSQMACMPVGRRVQTCRTSVLERVPYKAHVAIWDIIACVMYGAVAVSVKVSRMANI